MSTTLWVVYDYEVGMFTQMLWFGTTVECQKFPAPVQNAVVESMLLHLRILVDVLLSRGSGLRLRWADWNEYSPLVTWPDEPGWDCWWVAKDYRLGRATTRASKTLVAVTYTRLGLLCVGSQFEPNPKVETIGYELVRSSGAWRVDGPIPDYPYVGLPTVRRSLEKTIADSHETSDSRERARKSLKALTAVAESR